eukprot:6471789-Amphidinium_carterae.1
MVGTSPASDLCKSTSIAMLSMQAGWSQLRKRTLGERHRIFEEMEKPEVRVTMPPCTSENLKCMRRRKSTNSEACAF